MLNYQKHLGEKRFYLVYTSMSLSIMNSRQEPGVRNGSKDHGRMLMLVFHYLFGVPFKITTQVHLFKRGITHIGLDPLTSIIK